MTLRSTPGPALLALRALGLGDVLVAVPALRAVTRAFPGYRRLLALPAWLHPLCGLIGRWQPVAMANLADQLPRDLPRIEVAINLHGSGALSATVLERLHPTRRIGHRRPGWPGPEWLPEIPERLRWCRLLRAHGITADETDFRLPRPRGVAVAPGAVLVHPGAGYGAKRWPVARFAEVAAAHAAEGRLVLVTGSGAERARALRLAQLAGLPTRSVLAGRTSVLELAGLVSAAGLVVSGDTGIAHLAYAFGTPSITLFGPVDASQWGPPSSGPHLALQRPELRQGDPFARRPDPALLAITVADVLVAGARLGLPAATPLDATGA